MTPGLRVVRLTIYPVKGCRGRDVPRVEVGLDGLEGDRMYVVSAEGTRRLVTQLEAPRLALIAAESLPSGLALRCDGRYFQMDQPSSLIVDVERDGRRITGWDCGEAAAGWLSRQVGEDVRLVALQHRDGTRMASDRHTLLEGSPLTLASEASLAVVLGDAGSAFDARRLRVNLVVSGAAAFHEDDWEELLIGTARFRVESLRTLCGVVNVDPEQGTRGKTALRSLARTRPSDREATFGVNLRPLDPSGGLCVGDEVQVIMRNRPPPQSRDAACPST